MIRRWAVLALCVLSSVLVTLAGPAADDINDDPAFDLWSMPWDAVASDDHHQVT